MTFLIMMILMALPTSPDQPITCARYIPGTDTPLPAGVDYRYTQVERMENDLRCYCERVKPAERACKERYQFSLCVSRTHRWINATFGPPMPMRVAPGSGRNMIVNIQPR
jgi:hypothetical protein